jgi:hypothetical protein
LRSAVLAAINLLLPKALANSLIGAHLERKRTDVAQRVAKHAARVRPWPHALEAQGSAQPPAAATGSVE